MPAGDAREPLRSMPEPAVHQGDTFIVFDTNHVNVLLHERTGSDQGHFATVDIEELRELVQAVVTQKIAKPVGAAGVVLGIEILFTFAQWPHRLQLVAGERLTVSADALLPEKRCVTVDQDDEHSTDEDDHEDQRCEHDGDEPGNGALPAVHGTPGG